MQKKKVYSIDRYETRALNKKNYGERFDEYLKALVKLEAALEKDPLEDNLAADATVHRFELIFELSYRLMKAYLEYKGRAVSSPREVFRKSTELEMISDSDKWIEMMGDRNITSHIYDEEQEREIYKKIKNEYIDIFKCFSKKLKRIRESD